jgi:hypothetical protein
MSPALTFNINKEVSLTVPHDDVDDGKVIYSTRAAVRCIPYRAPL